MRVHAGAFSFLQEVIGSNVAGIAPVRVPKDASPVTKALARARIDSKALKMAVYGFFVSAPLGHFLVGLLQKAFAGKTGLKARLGQLLASNLLVAPIQTTGACSLGTSARAKNSHLAFLSCMAIINGAKSLDEVIRTVKGGFFSVIRVSRISRARRVFSHSLGVMDSFPNVNDYCTTVHSCRSMSSSH